MEANRNRATSLPGQNPSLETEIKALGTRLGNRVLIGQVINSLGKINGLWSKIGIWFWDVARTPLANFSRSTPTPGVVACDGGKIA